MNSKESPEVWTPPELIALVRNKPEEAVLLTCKTMYGVKVDDSGTETGCVSLKADCGVQCSELPYS
jgi:hypothetical protein